MTFALRAGCSLGALLISLPAHAQTSEADLVALVRAQAAEIAALKARVEKLEGAPQATAIVPPAAAPVAAAPVVQAATSGRTGVVPFAPQIIPPGPADRSIDQVLAANPSGLTSEWGSGFPVFHSADGVFTFKPRGRILVDVSHTRGSSYKGRNLTTTGMRALRAGIEGSIGSRYFWQFETDFSDNQVDVVTAFMGWRSKIKGTKLDFDVRVGHLFNDRSFEGGTGSDATPFLERTVVATAIIPQRGFYGLGIQPRVFGPNWHASVTLSGDRIDGDQSTSDSRTIIGRAHWNPLKSDRSMLHLGAWGFDEKLSSAAETLTRNTVIGGRFNSALRVSTGPLIGGLGTRGYGLELGGYAGPLWVMGEWGRRNARIRNQSDFVSKAWSLSGGYFLTGELPPYNPRTGNLTQPQVKRPTFDGGPGAIELTARYENLDYTDLLTGGDGWAATVGVNWYLNSFTRIMVNGIHWHTDNRAGAFTGSDDGQTLSARLGVTF